MINIFTVIVQVVNLALKEALEEKKTQWEGVEEVEEEYEQEEGGETDEDDLIKSNEEDVKRGGKPSKSSGSLLCNYL